MDTAFRVCEPTVSSAVTKAIIPTPIKYRIFRSIRYAKLSNQYLASIYPRGIAISAEIKINREKPEERSVNNWYILMIITTEMV